MKLFLPQTLVVSVYGVAKWYFEDFQTEYILPKTREIFGR